jgi:hypothetical protein
MNENPLLLVPYNDNQTLYRAATSRKWIKQDGSVRRQAFYRRKPPDDRDGLSCSPFLEHCRDGLKFPTYGVVTINAGRVRNAQLGLDVVPDSPTHGNIVGMPDRDGNERGRHDFMAQTLAGFAGSIAEPPAE